MSEFTNISDYRSRFPILNERVHNRDLVYLDSANTSQKPDQVIDAISRYYRTFNSNIHRATHCLSEKATKAYEDARGKVQRFINAADVREIVYVRGCTEAINLVASTWGRANLRADDEVIISWMEHHSNIVPWQLICDATGAKLRVVPIDEQGVLDIEAYHRMLNERTKLVSIIHVSNSMGTVNPVNNLVEMAKSFGAVTLVDGAQAVPHMPVDVQEIGCDFYTFSSHKMYGPMGIGALYGSLELLNQMPPYQGGGDMIRDVTFEKTTYNKPPYRFEAGTPNVADAIGLGAAVDFLNEVGLRNIASHEQSLLEYGTVLLNEISGVKIIGNAPHKAGVLSFVIDGIHPHDIGTFLDMEGIAVRTGQHCCQPVMDRFGIPATTRASLGLYNNREDLDRLAAGVRRVVEVFS